MRDEENLPRDLLKMVNQKISNLLFGLRPLVPQVKDTAILMGWIAGLVLIAGISWFLTQPVRNRLLLQAVNRVLEQSGDPRRLGEPVSPRALKGNLSGMGSWYTLAQIGNSEREGLSTGRMALIFTFFGEGSFFPCLVVLSPGGKAEEFIPLSSYGERMLKQLSPEIFRIYARRIEGSRS